MALFRRRNEQRSGNAIAPGVGEAAMTWGLQPAANQPFDTETCDVIREVSRTLHGFPARSTSHTPIPAMSLTDVYRGVVNGRTVTVADVHTPTETDIRLSHAHLTSLVAVELPTFLMMQGIEPRQHHSAFHGTEVPTGNTAFDAKFRVVGDPVHGSGLVTPDMQSRIMSRDDWTFAIHEAMMLSIAKGAFGTTEEAGMHIADVLAIVVAPHSAASAPVDRSVDDLLVRIERLQSVDEGIAFLQQLSDEDRQRLAQSPTPLARFAHVRTPDEAISLFMSLPEADRFELLAMFSKATGN
jgi:hypothetical protein